VVGATVTVQSNQNSSWPLIGDGAGNYAAPGLNLSPGQQYRLLITTSSGLYASDFVPVQPTPPIDSVGYMVKNAGVQLYVNTHDPTGTTKYYRWDYGEAWEFHANYVSQYAVDTTTRSIVFRVNQVYYCFAHDSSTNIFLASTTHLSKDVVYKSPLTNIPLSSEKVELKYSILVKQYGLTAGAYQFYYYLQQNSEQLGTIFDPEPSQIDGNIHNIANPNEPVIGYVTVTNVQSKRIFISEEALLYAMTIYPYDCGQDTVKTAQIQSLIEEPGSIITTVVPGGYLVTTPQCGDCTIRGVTQPPPFWK
jgi:hypothetical protein